MLKTAISASFQKPKINVQVDFANWNDILNSKPFSLGFVLQSFSMGYFELLQFRTTFRFS